MEKEILRTIRYFDFFDYSPTIEEIYTFLPKKTTKERLKKELEYLINKKIIKNLKFKIKNCFRYTVGGYGIIKSQISNLKSQNYRKIQEISQKKIKKIGFYIRLLSFFPQIKLVGLSGTIAMMNAKEEDDIDLFIITGKNRLWTGRFVALVLSQFLGIRRKRFQRSQKSENRGQKPEIRKQKTENQISVFNSRSSDLCPPSSDFSENIKDKVCLNLFFDESDLGAPDFKKTEYVAHEILQMKPLINKDGIYKRFLMANEWVFEMFPNALNDCRRLLADFHRYPRKSVINPCKSLFNLIEVVLKKIQLYLIYRHRTTEIITDHQLWFHPQDFGKKIRSNSKVE